MTKSHELAQKILLSETITPEIRKLALEIIETGIANGENKSDFYEKIKKHLPAHSFSSGQICFDMNYFIEIKTFEKIVNNFEKHKNVLVFIKELRYETGLSLASSKDIADRIKREYLEIPKHI